eukprot:PhM_4_TR9116/c0_g1_i1/m.30738/K08151/tetA; MFS transporter, DHA1 family, tetracycline resistance protein
MKTAPLTADERCLCVGWGGVGLVMGMLWLSVADMLRSVLGPAAAASMQGVLTSITAASGLVLTPIAGHLSDRFGRRRVLLAWTLCFGAAMLVNLVAEVAAAPGLMILSRVVSLAVATCLVHATAADIDATTTTTTTSSANLLLLQGRVQASFGAGVIAGPLCAGGIMKYVSGGRTLVFALPVPLVMCVYHIFSIG